MNAITDALKGEINEAVRKHLPAHLSDVLRVELERIPVLEKSLAATNLSVATISAQRDELRTINSAHGDLKVRENAVAAREKAVADVEFRIKIAEIKAESANNARSEMRSIVSDVFANHRYKYMENLPVVVPASPASHQGGYASPACIQNATRTVEGEG